MILKILEFFQESGTLNTGLVSTYFLGMPKRSFPLESESLKKDEDFGLAVVCRFFFGEISKDFLPGVSNFLVFFSEDFLAGI